MIYITLTVLVLALIVSVRLNYWLWKKAEQPDLIGLAVSFEQQARGSAHDLDQEALDQIAEALKRGTRHIDIARGLIPTPDAPRKLSATQLGKLHKMPASAIQERLVQLGYMVTTSGGHRFTSLGLRAGGEFRKRDEHADGFMVWPVDIPLVTSR